MKSQHETLLIIAVSSAVFFGAIAGGVTAVMVTDTLGDIPAFDLGIEGLSPSEEQAIIGLLKDEQATIAVVEQVAPAVVSIFIEKEFPIDPLYATEPGETDFFEIGGGTGFFVTEDGLILTNKHVVIDSDARYIVVTDAGDEYEATVLATDVFLDLAVLKIEGSGFPTVMLGDSDRVKTGQSVIAIGNTLSEFPNSVTKGIVSGVNRTIIAGNGFGDEEVIDGAIQTDAAISEGNSGGPLINLYGEVIGVNTAVSREGQSLGFAIPINIAKSIVSDVAQYGRIIRPWLGVRYVMIDEVLQEEESLPVSAGAYVLPSELGEPSVIPGSPADKAGLLPLDIVTAVNGIILDEETSLTEAIGLFEPGETVTLEVIRGNEEAFQLDVTLVELNEDVLEQS